MVRRYPRERQEQQKLALTQDGGYVDLGRTRIAPECVLSVYPVSPSQNTECQDDGHDLHEREHHPVDANRPFRRTARTCRSVVFPPHLTG